MNNSVISKLLNLDIARFLMSGGFNTALTYGMYLGLLTFLSYQLSYTLSYVAGIVLAYLLNRFFVFKSHQGVKSAVMLPLIYLVQYLLSVLILWVWVERFQLDSRLAPLVAIVLTLPVTFLLSRFAFKKR
ncbi:GtrA-like protein [compost metagenome]|jgi:putative flippase GtrA|uniref:GtrA family protein n=1 Tax=Pseudomonas putida (strain ATCC 700007 / DSM 6899 / JCM 31910 / BCRC 17059 / LMG 24140 / F1) TaxID=351746 RepID=A5W7E5_PSEP1|nr:MULTISPECIES: GtrA family protein [Pseudomonas]MDD1998857.1 GtrA family protein [Pseudomonas putida]MEB3437649.1 GtrA family protein [Pseudomonas sp. A2]MPT20877.1 GtrA family protein [Pseudomonas sp.]POA86666.1 GtrA family protein [Pseudomonas sp. FW305-E2]HDS1791524.1 GtrA family protein [Pseudomonas putida]